MEIGALSSALATGYVPRATAADGTVERPSRGSRDSTDTTAKSVRNGNFEPARQEALQTARQTRDTPSVVSSSPRVQFKDAEGTQVMSVYDSKSVLIYQVPTKGLLRLIHDKQRYPRVETSA